MCVCVCVCVCVIHRICSYVLHDNLLDAKYLVTIIFIIIMMIVSLVCLSMLSCTEQVLVSKYKTHAYNYKTSKTAHVQTTMLKHPTKQ